MKTEHDAMAELRKLARDMDDPRKLHPDLRPWVEGPFSREGNALAKYRLRHPLVYSIIGPLLPHQCNEIYTRKLAYLEECVQEKNWRQYLWLHERPYRMEKLEELYKLGRISVAELRTLLLDFWTDTEIPQGNQEEPLRLFRIVGFCTDDPEGFAKLPKVRMKLFRGVDGVCELTPDGPSWTRSRSTADFFAKRYAQGKTYSITVDKDDPAVLAWITGRDETEIILDFDAPGTRLDRSKIKVEADFTKEGR